MEHLVGVESILKLFKESGFKLAGNKCQFARSCTPFLGHIVCEDGFEPQPMKQNIIKDWKVPTNLEGVQQFVGLCGFYRRFIQNFRVDSAIIPTKSNLEHQKAFKY